MMRRYYQLKSGGQEFALSRAEFVIFDYLRYKSPCVVKHEELLEQTKYSKGTIKTAIRGLRPLVEHEGGTIEVTPHVGYRIVTVGKFE